MIQDTFRQASHGVLDGALIRDLVQFEYRSMVIRQLQVSVEWQQIEWLDQAACSPSGVATQQTCAGCPVRSPCLAAGLAVDDPAPWRGGVCHSEREELWEHSSRCSPISATAVLCVSIASSTAEEVADWTAVTSTDWRLSGPPHDLGSILRRGRLVTAIGPFSGSESRMDRPRGLADGGRTAPTVGRPTESWSPPLGRPPNQEAPIGGRPSGRHPPPVG
jgi:hypothetical protein